MKRRSRHFICRIAIIGLFFLLANSCRKSDSNNIQKPGDTVFDLDGNVYHAITIGTQVWMLENLKTTRYRNGDAIPENKEGILWNGLTTGAYCNYNNDAAAGNKYGRLYNWYAAADGRNIAPEGWHVATDAEWTTLLNYIAAHAGASGSQAKALASKTDWVPSITIDAVGNDISKNNTSGFTALPGSCYFNGMFRYIDYLAYWWCATGINDGSAWMRAMYTDNPTLLRASNPKVDGFSIRCVRDAVD